MTKRPVNPYLLTGILAVHATIAAFTWRDILSRSDAEVRGPKPVWFAASAINTVGSLAYWLFGRR